MAKFCKFCGAELKPNAKFCPKCGKSPEAKGEPVTAPVNNSNEADVIDVTPQPIAPKVNTVAQPEASTNKASSSNKLVIAIVSALIVLVLAGGGYYVYDQRVQAELAAEQAAAEAKAEADKAAAAQEAAKKAEEDKAKNQLNNYVADKDRYDKEIAELASDINAYAGSHGNFRGASHLVNRTFNIINSINTTKKSLTEYTDGDATIRAKLIEVLNAETGRVEGLRDGMQDSMRGQDYHPGFARGTTAAYKYDDLNAELNNLLKK